MSALRAFGSDNPCFNREFQKIYFQVTILAGSVRRCFGQLVALHNSFNCTSRRALATTNRFSWLSRRPVGVHESMQENIQDLCDKSACVSKKQSINFLEGPTITSAGLIFAFTFASWLQIAVFVSTELQLYLDHQREERHLSSATAEPC